MVLGWLMRRLAVLVVATSVLSGCGADGSELTATDVSSVRVVDEIEQAPARAAYLSPDGTTVLYYGDAGTCVRGVDGTNEHCLRVELDAASAAWSPDGASVALTEPHMGGLEPDIWVLDVRSGELTDRTDDGVAGGRIDLSKDEPPDGATVDMYPSWSADGTRIRFVRRMSARTIALMAVAADGGVPTKLRTIDTRWSVPSSVAWSAEKFAWLSGSGDSDDRVVRVIDIEHGGGRHLLVGQYWYLSFSQDGKFLLADEPGRGGGLAVGKARVVPTDGGDPMPVASGQVTQPTWAPAGHAIAYVDSTGLVRMVGRPGDPPKDVYGRKSVTDSQTRLQWAPGRLLVMVDGTTPYVLVLRS